MPDFIRTTWRSSSIRRQAHYVHQFLGESQGDLVFVADSKAEVERVADLLRGAYQTGREELMAELAELAKQDGGLGLVGHMVLGASNPQNCATEHPHPNHNWERGATVVFQCPGVKDG